GAGRRRGPGTAGGGGAAAGQGHQRRDRPHPPRVRPLLPCPLRAGSGRPSSRLHLRRSRGRGPPSAGGHAMTVTSPATMLVARPAFEGANIRAWIGFKHFMYLIEAAVLRWLESSGAGPGRLYLENGLGTEIVDCSVQLPVTLELDDEVRADVHPA